MTLKELKNKINSIPEEYLDWDVIIALKCEVYRNEWESEFEWQAGDIQEIYIDKQYKNISFDGEADI